MKVLLISANTERMNILPLPGLGLCRRCLPEGES